MEGGREATSSSKSRTPASSSLRGSHAPPPRFAQAAEAPPSPSWPAGGGEVRPQTRVSLYGGLIPPPEPLTRLLVGCLVPPGLPGGSLPPSLFGGEVCIQRFLIITWKWKDPEDEVPTEDPWKWLQKGPWKSDLEGHQSSPSEPNAGPPGFRGQMLAWQDQRRKRPRPGQRLQQNGSDGLSRIS